MEQLIAGIALVLSIVALIWQAVTHRQQRTEGLIVQNLAAMAQLERSLADIPEAFRFHGITAADMTKAGFTPGELAYLAASFSTGGIFHRLEGGAGEGAFGPTNYRYTLCQSERVRDAWPLIERMLTETPYKRRVIATLRNIHGDRFREKLTVV